MLSDPFNNTLRELLAPKGVAKWPFDPSSGLLIHQGGIQNLARFGFKLHPTEAKSIPKFENPGFGEDPGPRVEHFRTPSSKPTVGSV